MEKDKSVGEFDRKSSIAIFFSGLFNFYQFAAFEVKQSFLDLIKSYLLKFKKELILSLPGLMLCMLPALEDQNGEIIKKVENILNETEKIVGTSEFYGEIWKTMLRTPRARLSAIKYLDKRIPKNLKQARELREKDCIYISEYTIKIVNREVSLMKDQNRQEEEERMRKEMELADYFYFYYPNKSSLVINALTQGLSIVDNQVYVNRGSLDFLISHMPINSGINSIEENIRLVECATLAYTKKDFATMNKISNWLFGHLDESEEEIKSDDPTIITIVESQKNLFNQSMDVKLQGQLEIGKVGQEQTGLNKQSTMDKMINNPILILLRIISDEQLTTVPILNHLSIHLIKFIRFHLNNRNADANKFQTNLKNLLEQIQPNYQAVLGCLSKKLKDEINDFQPNSQTESFQLESIELISFAVFDLPQLYTKLLSSNEAKEEICKILYQLLKGLNNISNNILQSIEVVDKIIYILRINSDGVSILSNKRRDLDFREAIESFNSMYVKMSMKLIDDGQNQQEIQDDVLRYKQELQTFDKYTQILLSILQFQNINPEASEMPEWLEMLILTCKTGFPKISLVSTQNFLRILRFIPAQKWEGNSLIMQIQRMIADSTGTARIFSSSKVLENPKQYHWEFLDFLQKQERVKEGVKSGHTHCKEIIQNLWSMLDQEVDTENVVINLQKFDELVPRIFSDVVIEDLQNKLTKSNQEKAIKKFTIFWKFTEKHYPSYMPFETEISGKKYLAVHNMINFLEDPDPTLRLSCRSWLSQQSRIFCRILDPLIEEFIKNSNFKMPNEQAVIIEGELETQYVIQNFGKLRNIILNAQDDIIDYMIKKHCQTHIMMAYNSKIKQKGSQQTDKRIMSVIDSSFVNIPHEQKPYLDILVEITLYFIRAEYSSDLRSAGLSQMQLENQSSEILTVNASANEFMELILKQVEKYPLISNKIAHIIMSPMIDTFYAAVQKRNYAMQVNIINLLNLILYDCNFLGTQGDKTLVEESKSKCSFILKDQKLIDAIILGLKCDVSFVRQKLIKFVEMLVPFLKKFTKDNEGFKVDFQIQIEKLIDCFCDLLSKVDVSFFQSSAAAKKTTVAISKMGLKKAKTSIASSVVGAESFQSLTINQENDIVLILGGLECILNTCLGLEQKIDEMNDEQEVEDNDALDDDPLRLEKAKRVENKKTGFFGLFGGGESNIFTGDYFEALKKSVHKKLQNVLISCILCWNHLEILNWNDYHFTRHGVFAFYQEDQRRMVDKLRIKRSKIQKQQLGDKLEDARVNKQQQIEEADSYLSFEETVQLSANQIQKKILHMLRPIAKKNPDQLIDGAIEVWLSKSKLSGTDVNRSYEKLIQILVCVYQATENKKNNKTEFILPPYQVISSLVKHIQANFAAAKNSEIESKVAQLKWTKNMPALSSFQTTSETLLNSFLYTYLMFNPTMFDSVFENKSEEKTRELQKTYNHMLKYFNVFRLSRNPFTICWLVEILNVVSLKFNVQEAKLDNRMKKEYHDLFNNILSNFSSILTDSFGIQFQPTQRYDIALPPTVYELLWRYEYITYKKSQIVEGQKLEEKELVALKEGKSMKQWIPEKGRKDSQDVMFSDKPIFFNESELKLMVDQQFEYKHNGGTQVTDSSIFKNMEVLSKNRQDLHDYHLRLSNFMEKIRLALRNETDPNSMLVQAKYFCVLTLKQLLCQLLVNLVGTGDNEKTTKSMQIILLTTIELLQANNKNKSSHEDSQVMNEIVTEFFASIVERSHQIDPNLIKPYRRDIVELFNVDSFFQASILNLRQWQKIMKYFIDGKPDEMFEEQMQKWSTQGGLFVNMNQLVVQKCYSMKRIAFLIFSCNDDDFENQMDILLKKMIEFFKQKQKTDNKQRLFLLFLTRVLLIRLNFNTLTEALRKLWPHLLNELISVFETKMAELSENQIQENTDLTIEAIKLVQLLSSLNIEDFQMNQWIFLVDGYGMKEETGENRGQFDQNDLNENRKTQKRMTNVKNVDSETNNEVFRTFIVKFMGEQQYSFYNVEQPRKRNQEQDMLSVSLKQSLDSYGIVSEESKIQESGLIQSGVGKSDQKLMKYEMMLQQQACSLQQSINDSNVNGNEFNRQDAELKIEKDFIDNDAILNILTK